jgi:hypothetical protein
VGIESLERCQGREHLNHLAQGELVGRTVRDSHYIVCSAWSHYRSTSDKATHD